MKIHIIAETESVARKIVSALGIHDAACPPSNILGLGEVASDTAVIDEISGIGLIGVEQLNDSHFETIRRIRQAFILTRNSSLSHRP